MWGGTANGKEFLCRDGKRKVLVAQSCPTVCDSMNGCVSIVNACIELLSVSLCLNFFQDVAISNCIAITDLDGLSCFYKVYLSMVLSLLRTQEFNITF